MRLAFLKASISAIRHTGMIRFGLGTGGPRGSGMIRGGRAMQPAERRMNLLRNQGTPDENHFSNHDDEPCLTSIRIMSLAQRITSLRV